jgi:hypothetical protein
MNKTAAAVRPTAVDTKVFLPFFFNQNLMRLLLLVAPVLFFFSCTETPKEEAPLVKSKTLVALPVSPGKVKGIYSGNFKGSPISLVLNFVSNRHASGYNVHKGLTRNLAGTIAFASGKLHLQLSEPGNNPFDGQFDLEIDTAKWSGKGVWKPLKKGEETTFTFKKNKSKEWDLYNYGPTYMDSLSNYIALKPDGSCTYSYLTDTTNTAQQLTIRGNYQKDKNTVIIYWQKNDVFPSGKSVFKSSSTRPYPEDPDFTQETLKGEGRVFTEMIGD